MADAMDSGPRLSSRLIRTAGRLVPRDAREAWEKEWLSELWHSYFGLLRDGIEEERADRELLPVCSGAFRDAAHLRAQWVRERLRPSRLFAHPKSVLTVIGILLVAAIIGTGGLQAIRNGIRGLPYPQSGNLVLLRRTAMVLGMNASPSLRLAHLWTDHPSSVIKVSPFAWSKSGELMVTRDFFDVLGMQPALGSAFTNDGKNEQVVISYESWQRVFGGCADVIGRQFSNRTVSGVMPAEFWFLGRRVPAIVRLHSDNAPTYVNVVGRLTDVRFRQTAERELADVGRRKFIVRVEATPILDRVRRPLIIAIATAALAVLISGIWALLARILPGGRSRPSAWFSTFFVLKVSGVSAILSIIWAELVMRQRLTENGALEMSSLMYMLMLVGAQLGAFAWACYDQKKRCRTCCLPVAQPVTFGTWSSTLLDQPAIEFLCPNGHGSLYEHELRPAEPPTWTSFDESWRDADISQPQ